MENICDEYPVNCNGRCVGMCKIEKQGIRYKISAKVNVVDCDKPFRLAAICGDSIVNLGIMIPQSGSYCYSRVYTNAAIKELELSDISGFTIINYLDDGNEIEFKQRENISGNWRYDTDPGALLEEGEFRRIFSRCHNTMVRRDEEITYLAVPVVRGEEFQAMPVFCLGEARKINDRIYLVFKIHNGKLIF